MHIKVPLNKKDFLLTLGVMFMSMILGGVLIDTLTTSSEVSEVAQEDHVFSDASYLMWGRLGLWRTNFNDVRGYVAFNPADMEMDTTRRVLYTKDCKAACDSTPLCYMFMVNPATPNLCVMHQEIYRSTPYAQAKGDSYIFNDVNLLAGRTWAYYTRMRKIIN